MNDEIYEEELIPTPRTQTFDPQTIGDYRTWMQKVTGREMRLLCILTAHWPLAWYRELASEVKYERDKGKWPVVINSWIKKARAQ